MSTASEIREEIDGIFATRWQRRDGLVVPESTGVKLGNDAVKLDAAVLYADLADSTELVDQYKDFFAAEVYKTYLYAACRVIRDNGGEITAFDGDRVMAVYIGDTKNSDAARSALKINWAIKNVINPSIQQAYPSTSFKLRHCVGVDTSSLFVARTGIRGANDLVWVGRAANYAAKLCSIRDGNYSTIITEQVYKRLNDKSKYGGQPRRVMWEKTMWTDMGIAVYGSTWSWPV